MKDLYRRFLYGLNRLKDEFIGKEDYWHLRLPPADSFDKVYFLQMKRKADYSGEFIHDIPIYYLNGKFPVFFHITTLNYALGLLECYYMNNDNHLHDRINNIFLWLIKNQQQDGSWRYTFPLESKHVLADNKPSGMTQALAISFIIRILRGNFLPHDKKYILSLENAVKFMLSDEIICTHDGIDLIEEFYNPGNGILNGYIFTLLGLYDYCQYKSDYTLFDVHISNLKRIIKKYNFFIWTRYDLVGTISSRFYHQLHIDMMTVLYKLTGDMLFLKYRKRWKLGMYFSFLFVLLKAIQKAMNINVMVMSYSKKL